MKKNPVILSLVSAAVVFFGLAALTVSAQVAAPPPMPAYQPLSDQQLDQLLAPIALYPDPLLAQILPASTLPTQIVLADRYMIGGGDPNLVNQQPWDPSVQALVRYPSVLQYLDNNLAWTTELGQAFLNQQQQVMDSVQRLRASAQNYGNLVSTPQQQVEMDDGEVEILPVDPNVIYVPVYPPDLVYYQAGCPLGFGVGFPIGAWLNCDFDWHQHHLFSWNPEHPRPVNWWHEQPGQRTAWLGRAGEVWRPEDHRNPGAAQWGDRGWQNPPAAPQPDHNSVVWMSRPNTGPRPAATPRPPAQQRPAAVRETGGFQVQSPSAPANRSVDRGAFIGSESSRDARDFSNRGQESLQEVAHSEPAHSEAPAAHPAPPAGGGGSHGSGPRR